VVRCLVEAGHQVRALVRPASGAGRWIDPRVEWVEGDLKDIDSLRRGVGGCAWVFHVAALYSFWGHGWEDFYQTNVQGTRHVLDAAAAEGVRRVVYTSSIAALGFRPDRSPATEDTPVSLADRIGFYQRSKYLAEEVAHDAARHGLPVVIVNPSTPVGVGDHKPTPTGQIIVDFLSGRMLAYVDAGLNVVDVEDVATGHLLAAERGRVGEQYILGGENLTLKGVLDVLADVSGRPRVRLRIPHSVAMAWALLDVARSRVNPRRTPTATPEKVRLSRRYEFYDPGKAVRELGLPQTPAREALRKAVEWYRAHGYAP
jgi:dihydroflavonol-4-reductase